jgi:hypothetical protein
MLAAPHSFVQVGNLQELLQDSESGKVCVFVALVGLTFGRSTG